MLPSDILLTGSLAAVQKMIPNTSTRRINHLRSSAGICPLSVIKSSQHRHLPGDFRAFHASICYFPAGLTPANTTSIRFVDRATRLKLKPRNSLWFQAYYEAGRCKTPDQRNLGFINTSSVPQADHFHPKPHCCSNS